MTQRSAAGTTTTTDRDGTRTDRFDSADPRIGLPARFASNLRITLPSSVSQLLSSSRSATTSGTLLTQQIDTQCVNGTGTPDQCTGGFKTISTLALDSQQLGTRTTQTPAGRTIVEQFDTQSRPVSMTLPGTIPITTSYDSFGRVATSTQGTRQTLFDYSATTGFLTSITDASAHVTAFSDHDGVGRPRRITLPGGAEIALAYDPDSRISSVTPPGKSAHTFEYNALGRLAMYDPPVSPAIRHFYNQDRQLIRIEHDGTLDGGLVAELFYDPTTGQLVTVNTPAADIGLFYSPTTGQLNQLTSPEASSNIVLEQTFDGFLLSALRWSDQARGSVAWQHNNRFLVATETVRGGTEPATPVSPAACPTTPGCVAYNYEADGITTSITSGQSPNQVTYNLTPNATIGRIESKTIGVVQETLAYNAHGELARQTVINTATSEVLFDTVYDSNDALPAAAGKRDALGRILKKTETVAGVGRVFEYGYNPAGRPWLETVTVDGDLVSQYGYDGNGNRTSVDLDRTFAGGGTVSLSGTDIVTDSEDRLTKYGNLTLTYDELGRVIEKRDTSVTPNAVTTYGWDSLGALRRVELPDGRLIEYLIDAIGRRVGKKVNGVVQKRWIYRDTLRPVAELDAAGNVVARYVYADGNGTRDEAIRELLTRLGTERNGDRRGAMAPEFIVRDDGIFRIAVDQLGSVRLVVNVVTGAIALQRNYDDFGVILSESGAMAGTEIAPFAFAGGLHDLDTGLLRFGAREYDATVGRWITRDPSGFRGGINFYAYSWNDPVNFRDSTGRRPTGAGGASNSGDGGAEGQGSTGETGGYGYTPGWCGSGWSEPWVPEGMLGANWSSACENHDNCYGTCGSDKNVCDATLDDEVSASCSWCAPVGAVYGAAVDWLAPLPKTFPSSKFRERGRYGPNQL